VGMQMGAFHRMRAWLPQANECAPAVDWLPRKMKSHKGKEKEGEYRRVFWMEFSVY
jgi:hypothetical protein